MNKYKWEGFTIEIFDDPNYNYASTDNIYNYPKQYFSTGERGGWWKHGIKIYEDEDDQAINGCVLLGTGGKTSPHKTSIILENDRLVFCCGDTVFCLSLPNLELKWKTQADPATCFQIFKLEEDYLVHGELEITRLDKNGNPKWKFSGRDMFVTLKDENSLVIHSDYIELTDFEYEKYKIDFDGNLIWTSKKPF